ncbi:hypothetical protein D9758_015747 [Tetrapyrgos nigripes]|uniref:Uncharacterized protein n=1 Tax=Tetrapyrgos nigripes TaxID=182062 RepID=A0A8H5CBN7_9AGAR|nr:hypothetical protein D9758_015747 [Tetrapyrgos nigripes]
MGDKAEDLYSKDYESTTSGSHRIILNDTNASPNPNPKRITHPVKKSILLLTLYLTLYLTLGTLYHRYVLKLRGFDQVPQFSIQAARYHIRDMWDVDWRKVFEGISGRWGRVYGLWWGNLLGPRAGLGEEGMEGYRVGQRKDGGFRRLTPRRGTEPSGDAPNSTVDLGAGGLGGMVAGARGDVAGKSRGGLGELEKRTPLDDLGFGRWILAPLSKNKRSTNTQDVKSTQKGRTAFLLGHEDVDGDEEDGAEDITLGDYTTEPSHSPIPIPIPIPGLRRHQKAK